MTKPAGTTAIPNQTILSAAYNTQIDDLVADANAARPVTAGGTGASTSGGALTNLGVSDYAKTLLDDTDAVAARATLGVLWEKIASATPAAAAFVSFTDLGVYRCLRLTGFLYPSTASGLYLQLSTNNGAAWLTTSGDYLSSYLGVQGSSVSPSPNAITTSFPLTGGANVDPSSDAACSFELFLEPLAGARTSLRSDATALQSGEVYRSLNHGRRTATAVHNALRIIAGTGTLTGNVTLEGIRA